MPKFFLNKNIVEILIIVDFILSGISYFIQRNLFVTLIFMLIVLLCLVLIYKIKGSQMVVPMFWLYLSFFILSNTDTLLLKDNVIQNNSILDNFFGFAMVFPFVFTLFACYRLFMRGL